MDNTETPSQSIISAVSSIDSGIGDRPSSSNPVTSISTSAGGISPNSTVQQNVTIQPVPGENTFEVQEIDNQQPRKKIKLDAVGGEDQTDKLPKLEKLENRLVSLLCCTVCLDLPKSAIYQCNNGHLMCSGCFSHLLADARLKDEVATCPNCRVEISKITATRNLAVEKAVNELPAPCQYCSCEFPRASLERHEKELCEDRAMSCQYARIGCPWKGPFHELKRHESTCTHPSKTGKEVMDILRIDDQVNAEEKKLYRGLFDLLSFEKIHISDLQFKPYRTDEFLHKLFYETSRFTAFNNQWVVKAKINSSNQRDPTQSAEREVTYQLILKSKPANAAMELSFIILRGPFGDMKINPKIHHHTFTETNFESNCFPIPLVDSIECNRLLAGKSIHFRLIAFLQ